MTAVAPPIGNDGKQDFDSAYRTLIDSDHIQTDMTRFEPPEPSPPPDWLANLLQWLETLGPFWQAIFWIAIGGVLVLILYSIGKALYRRFSDRRPMDEAEEQPEAWRPEEQAARSLLDEADILARDGRYAEAARLLLFRSVADIEERLPDFLQPALTSRDIAQAPALPAPARSSFSEIARIVERGIFAARPVDEDGWRDARSAYEQFAFGKSWA